LRAFLFFALSGGMKDTKAQTYLPFLEPLSEEVPSPPERRAVHVSGYEREGRDFYATPAWVTEALLRHVRFRGPIWEPCCGTGAMSTVLAAHGYEVVSTDIADRGFGEAGLISFIAPRCRTVAAAS
jgi:hypothetical protein